MTAAPAPARVVSMADVAEPLRIRFAGMVVEQVTAGHWAHGDAALGLAIAGLTGDPTILATAVRYARDGQTSSAPFRSCVQILATPSPAPAEDTAECGCPADGLCAACLGCHDCYGWCAEALNAERADHAVSMARDAGNAAVGVLLSVACLAVAVGLIVLAGLFLQRMPGMLAVLMLVTGAAWVGWRLQVASDRLGEVLAEQETDQ